MSDFDRTSWFFKQLEQANDRIDSLPPHARMVIPAHPEAVSDHG